MILLNNILIEENTLNLGLENRAFRFGEMVFETISVHFQKPYLLNEHIRRFHSGIKLLNFHQEIPKHLQISKIEESITKLLKKNKKSNGFIRLFYFRESQSEGYSAKNLENFNFIIKFSSKPKSIKSNFTLGVSTIKKPISKLFSFKNASSIFYTTSCLEKTKQKVDDVLLLNEKGFLCETSCANIFIVKNNKIFTPNLESGCIDGVIRNRIISLIPTIKEKKLSIKSLLKADGVFLTNVSAPIQNVSTFFYENKKITYNKSMDLINNIKLLIKKDIQKLK
jgi:branched-chain amino acid aminotransferase